MKFASCVHNFEDWTICGEIIQTFNQRQCLYCLHELWFCRRSVIKTDTEDTISTIKNHNPIFFNEYHSIQQLCQTNVYLKSSYPDTRN